MAKIEERGGTPHNDLFLKNQKISDLFGKTESIHGFTITKALDRGVAQLLQRHARETVQVLLSLMRLHDTRPVTIKLAFHALVGLSKLDPIQKGELFGVVASYRADVLRGDLSSLQSRIGGTTGIGAGFGNDGLDSLSEDQLRARLRQTNNYMAQLEEALAGRVASSSRAPGTFADSHGYFRVLGLDPSTAFDGSEEFDLLLNACYRTLARKYHPDKHHSNQKAESEKKFKEIQNAYEELSDPERRKQYLGKETGTGRRKG